MNVGDYMMHHMGGDRGSLVRIEDEKGGTYGVQYVQIVGQNTVLSGGYSFRWPPQVFRRVTDPVLQAAANVFEAHRLAEFHRKEKLRHDEEARIWEGVMEVLSDPKIQDEACRKEKP